MDDATILGGLWPAEHTQVALTAPLRRRLNKLKNGVELERPAVKHFTLQKVATQPPTRAGQLLVKIMYLSLDGVCLQQRTTGKPGKAGAGAAAGADGGDAETLLTKVGGVVRGLAVGMIVAVGGQKAPRWDPADGPQTAAPGPFGVGQIVGGEFGWREYALISQDAAVAAPEDMALPTVLSTLQAAHK